MPAIVRLGDGSVGHGCFPPRPNDSASPNVFANSIPVHRQTDHWMVHCCGPACHDGVLVKGSPNVYVNNLPVARVGDLISCGDAAAAGSPNVFANSSTSSGGGTWDTTEESWNSKDTWKEQ